MKGLVIGGTRSGVGKTVAAMAVMHALREAGHAVQPAKTGPDFIDPSHHEHATSEPSRTLDTWLAGAEGVVRNYWRGTGDVCVVEGAMGLYDGDVSSTARVAEVLELPVVLVVDANAGMESVAATALGFRQYAERAGRDVAVAGVIAQRAHGGRHATGIREALPPSVTYFGRIPPDDALTVPDRHLGLELEAPLGPDALETAATHLRTDRLVDIAREPPRPPEHDESGRPEWADARVSGSADSRATEQTDTRVAVASDAAFAFRYPATTERLRERATVVEFSPVADDPLPPCDGVYLPGGYPEEHAARLAESRAIGDLHAAASDGLPVFAECGGLMALCESLTTTDGERHEMAGVLPATVTMHERVRALDHVELDAQRDTLTADRGTTLRGHEFHYSTADAASDARFAFDVRRGEGIDGDHDGLTEHRTLGTYCHVHPENGAFDTFLDRL